MMKDLIIFEGWQLLIDRAKRFFNVVVFHSERQKPGNSLLRAEVFFPNDTINYFTNLYPAP